MSETEGRNKESVVGSAQNMEFTPLNITERETESTKIENIGLNISDPKRRRIEGSTTNGHKLPTPQMMKKWWRIKMLRVRTKKTCY